MPPQSSRDLRRAFSARRLQTNSALASVPSIRYALVERGLTCQPFTEKETTMKNFVQPGNVLDLDPGATVASSTGHLFGAALFGVAAVDAVSGTASAFIIEGVVEIAKT